MRTLYYFCEYLFSSCTPVIPRSLARFFFLRDRIDRAEHRTRTAEAVAGRWKHNSIRLRGEPLFEREFFHLSDAQDPDSSGSVHSVSKRHESTSDRRQQSRGPYLLENPRDHFHALSLCALSTEWHVLIFFFSLSFTQERVRAAASEGSSRI